MHSFRLLGSLSSLHDHFQVVTQQHGYSRGALGTPRQDFGRNGCPPALFLNGFRNKTAYTIDTRWTFIADSVWDDDRRAGGNDCK